MSAIYSICLSKWLLKGYLPLYLISTLSKISQVLTHNILLHPESCLANLLTHSPMLCQRRGSESNPYLMQLAPISAGPVKCSKSKSPPKSRNSDSRIQKLESHRPVFIPIYPLRSFVNLFNFSKSQIPICKVELIMLASQNCFKNYMK